MFIAKAVNSKLKKLGEIMEYSVLSASYFLIKKIDGTTW